MRLIRGLQNLRAIDHGCVATIGNFDGVHMGHQAVITQLRKQAAVLQLPSVVITFEPQPQEHFAGQAAPPRLTRLREKIHALGNLGVDRVLCISFNTRFSLLSAERFIQQILIDGLAVKSLIVGDDFRFGRDRLGDFELLRVAGEQHGFQVSNTHSVILGAGRVSSTRVRDVLAAGDLQEVERLLGRAYCMRGRVAHGDKRGRTIGFPTANIHVHRINTPVKGVYAVRMSGIGGQVINGVANIGTRPTVGGTRTLLEVHLFDFNQDIYGAHVEVCFVKKLRDEQRFESFAALKQQIQRDSDEARVVFAG